jgi:hypothetical protein
MLLINYDYNGKLLVYELSQPARSLPARNRVLREKLRMLRNSRNTPLFVEPTGALPGLQEAAPGPYPASSDLFTLRSVLIISFHLCLSLPHCVFPLSFPVKTLCFSYLPCILYALPISFSLAILII